MSHGPRGRGVGFNVWFGAGSPQLAAAGGILSTETRLGATGTCAAGVSVAVSGCLATSWASVQVATCDALLLAPRAGGNVVAGWRRFEGSIRMGARGIQASFWTLTEAFAPGGEAAVSDPVSHSAASRPTAAPRAGGRFSAGFGGTSLGISKRARGCACDAACRIQPRSGASAR